MPKPIVYITAHLSEQNSPNEHRLDIALKEITLAIWEGSIMDLRFNRTSQDPNDNMVQFKKSVDTATRNLIEKILYDIFAVKISVSSSGEVEFGAQDRLLEAKGVIAEAFRELDAQML
jgi:hypothetical protein